MTDTLTAWLAEWNSAVALDGDGGAAKRTELMRRAHAIARARGEADPLRAAVNALANALDVGAGEAPAPAASVTAALEALAKVDAPDAMEPPAFTPASEIADDYPDPVLSIAGHRGAVLARGEAVVLGGGGGVGKSAMAGELALAIATGAGMAGATGGELFRVSASGPVLWLAYEETRGAIARRLQRLAETVEAYEAGPSGVHIADMSRDGRWALYGPGKRGEAAGLYNARPERLDGFGAMVDAIAAVEPALVVIDPVLAAYVGDADKPAAVREFLAALRGAAGRAGVLCLAHSTKAGRNADPLDGGAIGGSAAWTDAVRGAMSMRYDADGAREIWVLKANYGPARMGCRLWERRPDADDGNRWIVGFIAAAEWEEYEPYMKEADAKAADRAAAKNAGGGGRNRRRRAKKEDADTADTDDSEWYSEGVK